MSSSCSLRFTNEANNFNAGDMRNHSGSLRLPMFFLQELVQVLKALDEDSFDDAAIDSLLAGADSNGDGSLQVVEFLNWILGSTWIDLSDQRPFFSCYVFCHPFK